MIEDIEYFNLNVIDIIYSNRGSNRGLLIMTRNFYNYEKLNGFIIKIYVIIFFDMN